jgi:two-component system, LytTR family, response regulator
MRTPIDGFPDDDRQVPKDPRYPADASWQSLAGAQPALTRIAVKSVNRIVIVQVADIVRIEAEDNYVRLWAERPYLHKETLTGLLSRLSPQMFLRVHRSHAINVQFVRELRPQLHGEYLIVLANGTELSSGRGFRASIQAMFDL